MNQERIAEIRTWLNSQRPDWNPKEDRIITELLAEVERLQREATATEADILYRHGIIYEHR